MTNSELLSGVMHKQNTLQLANEYNAKQCGSQRLLKLPIPVLIWNSQVTFHYRMKWIFRGDAKRKRSNIVQKFCSKMLLENVIKTKSVRGDKHSPNRPYLGNMKRTKQCSWGAPKPTTLENMEEGMGRLGVPKRVHMETTPKERE